MICGDLPCDYVSAEKIKHPRDAMRSIAESWLEQSELMVLGETGANVSIGPPEEWSSLAPMLRDRASSLLEMVNDDDVWPR